MELIQSTLTTLGSDSVLLGTGFLYGFVWWLPRNNQVLTNFPLTTLFFSSFTGLIGSGLTFAVGKVMSLAECSWVTTVVLGLATLYQLGSRMGSEDPRERSHRNGWNGY